jgi:hypothetical protein
MKNQVLLILMLIVFGLSANAQKKPEIRLNGYAIGTFNDHVSSYYSSTDQFEGNIKGGLQWGFGIEIKPRKMTGIEFLYNRIDTKADMIYYNPLKNSGTFNTSINNYFLSINRYFSNNDKFEGYGGLMLGVTDAKVGNQSATKFGYGFKLGGNIWFSPKVGLKLQGQVNSASQAVGGGFYLGTGGAGAGVSSYSTFYQWGLGGGLVFKLGQ